MYGRPHSKTKSQSVTSASPEFTDEHLDSVEKYLRSNSGPMTAEEANAFYGKVSHSEMNAIVRRDKDSVQKPAPVGYIG